MMSTSRCAEGRKLCEAILPFDIVEVVAPVAEQAAKANSGFHESSDLAGADETHFEKVETE